MLAAYAATVRSSRREQLDGVHVLDPFRGLVDVPFDDGDRVGVGVPQLVEVLAIGPGAEHSLAATVPAVEAAPGVVLYVRLCDQSLQARALHGSPRSHDDHRPSGLDQQPIHCASVLRLARVVLTEPRYRNGNVRHAQSPSVTA